MTPAKSGLTAKLRFALTLALCAGAAACAAKPELPPLPPRADLCVHYASFRYSPAAAAVEVLDALDKHNANEAAFHEKCLLDPERPRGPR